MIPTRHINAIEFIFTCVAIVVICVLAMGARAAETSQDRSSTAYGAGRPGALQWTFTAKGPIASSSAIGADGAIYVGSEDSNLYAINPKGTRRWSYYVGQAIYSSPAIGADSTIYVGSNMGTIYAINPDGTLKWSYVSDENHGHGCSSPAIGADGTIYIGLGNSTLHALNPDGTLKWYFAADPSSKDGSSSPAVGKDGTIYIGLGDSILYAINPDGTLKWSYVSDPSYEAISSSPAIADDETLYVVFGGGVLCAVNPDGTLKWSHVTDPSYYSESSSPAIGADGTVYVGLHYVWSTPLFSGYCLVAIGSDGIEKWAYYTSNFTTTPAIGADGTIYVWSMIGFNAINPDGTTRWWFYAGDWSWISSGNNSSPAIGTNGTIYFGNYDYSKLYALHSASPGLADSPWPMFQQNPKHTGTPAALPVLTVTKSGTGNGTITSVPTGIDCGSTCSASFSKGAVVTLTATAQTGSTFLGWSGGCTGNSPCEVTMAGNITVTASFSGPACTYTVTPSSTKFPSSGGAVTVRATGKSAEEGICPTPLVTTSDPAWITAVSSPWKDKTSKVKVTVNANETLSERKGTVSIGDKTFSITQKKTPCVITMLTPQRQYVPAWGGSYVVNLYTSSQGCSWTASSNKGWITLDSPTGKGNGDVAYTVSENTTKKRRTGTITITLDQNEAIKIKHTVLQKEK